MSKFTEEDNLTACQYLASLGLNFNPIITEPEDDPMVGLSLNFIFSSFNYYQLNVDPNHSLLRVFN